MTFLAMWLLAAGLGDLLRPGAELDPHRRWWWPAALGVPVLLVVWLLAGIDGGLRLVALPLMAALLVGWAHTSTAAVAAGAGEESSAHPADPHRPAALAVLLVTVVVGFAVAGLDPAVAGPLARWWRGLGLASLATVPPTRALMVLAVVVAQVGTGNVVVRLVLDAAGAHREPGVLRGGRWLGPMERLFLVVLALAGQPTAAAVVVAAKGLLRFPELQDQRGAGQRIDTVTEYFLLGTFTSWLVALGSVLLTLR
ncbi:hypothetical protein [Arsenicicoccus dermatophilus]|uniref:hypothetical protein n=1 Tax=Arsenicicoccus dermatophilus TaxID=1076331 RepID=UPI001F4C52D5|nr:hypothetical protein [Arsenicicoccus dermatophilus]MCH8611891.1 hypothetical protein [Arsenicicoccus dermatophilus]